jgi:PAS domain S-box-containing protein
MINELTEMHQRTAKFDALVAERDQVTEELRASQAHLADILNIAPEAIISIDQKQRIILYNRGAEQIFGYSADEAIGQPLDILLPKEYIGAHRQHIADFAASNMTARLMGERQKISGRRKNGEVFPAEASISRLKGDETIFTVVLRDITERERAEAEREHLIVQLKALNEAARAITAELSLAQVLQKIVETARTLMKVKYAVLGIYNEEQHLSRFITAGISKIDYAKIEATSIERNLLGPLLEQGKSVIINNIAVHPTANPPKDHPPLNKLLGVPILSKGNLIGVLYLADKEDQSKFTTADQELVERLALHAAIAIENARLYERTQRLAILEERERFARDLHDGIIQSIYAVGLILEQAKNDIPQANQPLKEQFVLCMNNLAAVIKDIRNYIFDLRPQASKHQGLEARLEGLIKEVRANTLLPIHAEISPDVSSYLSDWQISHIFHICHEALSNAIRHAKPKQIFISLTREKETITLQVEDDGIGFELPPEINPGHRGLANIRTRVFQLGAYLHIDTAPQQGTRVIVNLKIV